MSINLMYALPSIKTSPALINELCKMEAEPKQAINPFKTVSDTWDLIIVELFDGEPKSASDIANAMPDKNPRTVRSALTEMEAKGVISKHARILNKEKHRIECLWVLV